MNLAFRFSACVAIALLPLTAHASSDGQHDFDFSIGTWKAEIRQLQKPLTGSTTWVKETGTVSTRKIWNGRANLEEVDLDTPAGHYEGAMLRLYKPKSHQWNLTSISAKHGVTRPAWGEFKDGRGEFYDQESLDGRTILVRQLFTDITPDSHRFEQAFSADRGRTWEPNLIAMLTRIDVNPRKESVNAEDRQRDFDFSYGRWKTHASTQGIEYDGQSEVTPIWNGRGSLLDQQFGEAPNRSEIICVRLYNTTTHEWTLNWANSSENELGVPTAGTFSNGRGEFLDHEPFRGTQVFVRVNFSDITPDSFRSEQAFSADGGKTWETNWITTFTRDRDGQHDFDFNVGTWKTHIRRLQHPLSGSTSWIEGDGVVSVRKIWNGRANLEEIDAHFPAGAFQGLTLRLYNQKTHQWNLSWANASDGVLMPPGYGSFLDGRGVFYDQETFNDRTIVVRQIYSGITADAYHFEQSFSADRGRTWEPNFIADLVRTSAQPVAQTLSATDRNTGFDFNFGHWKTHVSRLQDPLSGSNKWVEYDGTSEIAPVWNGRASLFELNVDGPAGPIEGMGLRLYNPETREWSLNWANSRANTLGVPTIGTFQGGRGEFMDQEEYGGRQIFIRNGFSAITPDSSRFEQAFSADGGKTWETNWIMTFAREK